MAWSLRCRAVCTDRVIDLREFRRIPRSTGMSQTVGAFRIELTEGQQLPQAAIRAFVTDKLWVWNRAATATLTERCDEPVRGQQRPCLRGSSNRGPPAVDGGRGGFDVQHIRLQFPHRAGRVAVACLTCQSRRVTQIGTFDRVGTPGGPPAELEAREIRIPGMNGFPVGHLLGGLAVGSAEVGVLRRLCRDRREVGPGRARLVGRRSWLTRLAGGFVPQIHSGAGQVWLPRSRARGTWDPTWLL